MARDQTREELLARRRVPQQPRAQDRVDRILGTAETLMQQHSIGSITAAALAEGAKIPIGSFYQYFPNKLAVFAELARRAMQRVDVEIVESMAEINAENWEEILDRTIDITMSAYRRQPGYPRLLLDLRATPEFRATTNESNARIAEFIATKTPLANIDMPKARIKVVARAAIETVNVLQDWALSIDKPAESRQIATEAKALLKQYLRNYAAEPGYKRP